MAANLSFKGDLAVAECYVARRSGFGLVRNIFIHNSTEQLYVLYSPEGFCEEDWGGSRLGNPL